MDRDREAVGGSSRGSTPDDERLATRDALSRALVSALDQDDVVATVTRSLPPLTGATTATVLTVCASGAHLHGHLGLGVPHETAERLELPLEDGPWRHAVSGTVAAGTIPADDGATPAMYVPMGPAGSGWVLALCFEHQVPTDGGRVSTCRAVADELWAALQRAGLVSDLRDRIAVLEATTAVASSAGLDLQATLATVTRAAAGALSCQRAAVYLCQPDGGLVPASVHATDRDVSSPGGIGTARAALDHHDTIVVQDTTQDAGFLDGLWHRDAGSAAVMAVPLAVGDRDVGVLVVGRSVTAPRPFTSLCREVGAAVAQQAALAIDHARRYEAERAAVRRLTELGQRERDYLAGVGHDLETPLRGLLGSVSTLKRVGERVSPERRREYLDVMERQATRVVAVVDDLRMAARADEGRVSPDRVDRLDLVRVVRDIAEAYDPESRGRLALHLPEQVPVVGDVSQLSRVVRSVVDNALTYAAAPTPVDVSVEAKGDTVRLVVRDRGIGIDPDERERVFERFGGGRAGTEAGSTGLGLFISRSIARGHGGELTVSAPETGDGTVVTLRLPAPGAAEGSGTGQ